MQFLPFREAFSEICGDGRECLTDVLIFRVALHRIDRERFHAEENTHVAIVKAHVDMSRGVVVRVDHDDEFSDPNDLRRKPIIT